MKNEPDELPESTPSLPQLGGPPYENRDEPRYEITQSLVDVHEPENEPGKVTVRIRPNNIAIDIHGCGVACMQEGFGEVIYLEQQDGKTRLLVWTDINREDPTHVIDFDGAKEENREED